MPVLLTVSALSGFDEVKYLAYEVPDVTIPSETLAAMASASADEREVGARLATDLVTQTRALADGLIVVVHGNQRTAPRLLAALCGEEQNRSAESRGRG